MYTYDRDHVILDRYLQLNSDVASYVAIASYIGMFVLMIMIMYVILDHYLQLNSDVARYVAIASYIGMFVLMIMILDYYPIANYIGTYVCFK